MKLIELTYKHFLQQHKRNVQHVNYIGIGLGEGEGKVDGYGKSALQTMHASQAQVLGG